MYKTAKVTGYLQYKVSVSRQLIENLLMDRHTDRKNLHSEYPHRRLKIFYTKTLCPTERALEMFLSKHVQI